MGITFRTDKNKISKLGTGTIVGKWDTEVIVDLNRKLSDGHDWTISPTLADISSPEEAFFLTLFVSPTLLWDEVPEEEEVVGVERTWDGCGDPVRLLLPWLLLPDVTHCFICFGWTNWTGRVLLLVTFCKLLSLFSHMPCTSSIRLSKSCTIAWKSPKRNKYQFNI